MGQALRLRRNSPQALSCSAIGSQRQGRELLPVIEPLVGAAEFTGSEWTRAELRERLAWKVPP